MLKLRRFFICLVLAVLLVSSSVFATNTTISKEDVVIKIEEPTTEISAQSIYEDLYIYNTESFTLSDNVYGNIFASTTKFVTNPRINGGKISGNLFVFSNDVVIGSDVTYSNNKDKNGNYLISSVNSKSIIEGNVYVFSESFTLEAGSEIRGDLYLASTNVNIHQDTVIDGNVFITGTDITINGQISGSAYITADNFTMNYFAYVSRDLFLNSENATLAGIVTRNAFVTVYDKLSTTSYFRVDQDLTVNSANNFTFAGEVKQNAVINAKNLSFNTEEKCVINGNLNYATKNDVSIADGIVNGDVSTSEYKEPSEYDFSIQDSMFSFVILLVYVLVIVCLARIFTPKAIEEKLSAINVKNVLISLAIGFASLFAIVIIFLFLCFSIVGVPLAFVALVAYFFVLALALPLLLYRIATMLKFKLNIYVKLLIVTAVYYLISIIPVIGSPVAFVTLLTGTGRVLLGFFNRKK